MSSSTENHGTVKMYWVFCVILCAITFVEWGLFKKKDDWALTGRILVPTLLGLSLIKFTMVVGWYMHLRFDHSWVKIIFIGSLIMGGGTAVALCILM